MSFRKKTIALAIILFLALLFALPAARDEFAWYWTESRDQATDYARYLEDWPRGRHVSEAKLRKEQRDWSDTKRAMISEALKKHAAAKSDPEAIREKKLRKERFFWKQANAENTVVSYQDYLQRYPEGKFSAEARRKIGDLTREGNNPANAPPSSQ